MGYLSSWLIILIIFVISGFVGALASDSMHLGYVYDKSVALPVPMELLQNPSISKWSASVNGKVVAKTDTTFTIAHITKGNNTDDNTLEIIHDQEKTIFVDANGNQTDGKISVGSVVRGVVNIEPIGSGWKVMGVILYAR